jgi:hypothetical protein
MSYFSHPCDQIPDTEEGFILPYGFRAISPSWQNRVVHIMEARSRENGLQEEARARYNSKAISQ